MKLIRRQNNSGYSIVELLFYLALFFVLAVAIFNSIIIMSRSFSSNAISTDLLHNLFIMERVGREIRLAESINTIANGNLILNTTNDAGTSITRRFELSGGDVKFYENGAFVGNLNDIHVEVNTLDFTQITTTRGVAVKVFLQMTPNRDSRLGQTENFYGTFVLRNAY